ncbi:MAG: YheC/YheD family protein [Bacillota bacterium]
MEEMSVRLLRDSDLPTHTVRLPGSTPGAKAILRLGSVQVEGLQGEPAPAGEVHLAPDLFDSLAIPYDSMPVALREGEAGQVEFGPAVAVLHPGRERLSQREALARAALYYGHLEQSPGLFALGFDEEIDWEQSRIFGYVLDTRPGREQRLIRTWFPIPAAVYLTWSIRRKVIDQLRERTGNRVFNWVRSIGKWEFHTLLSVDEALRPHLPETRLLGGKPDLAAMLIRHEVVFVKHVHGIRGRGSARVRRLPDGFELCYIGDREQERRVFPSLDELMPSLRAVTGQGRCVVQRGIPITGLQGRALHFRLVTVRRPEGGWRLVVGNASVASDDQMFFTNLANGAVEAAMIESLELHHSMRSDEAERCIEQMVELSLRGAAILEQTFQPLGILGFDLVVEQGSHQIWLLEANAVPGWGYPPEVERDLARSQSDLALVLTGF